VIEALEEEHVMEDFIAARKDYLREEFVTPKRSAEDGKRKRRA
jgi:hypothetical protein